MFLAGGLIHVMGGKQYGLFYIHQGAPCISHQGALPTFTAKYCSMVQIYRISFFLNC